MEQDATKRAFPSKLHFRFHHDDNKIVSVGVENLDVFNSKKPEVLSAWGLFGGEVQPGFKTYAGVYSGFGLGPNAFTFHKFLVSLKHKDLTSFVEFGLNRNVTTKVNEDKTETQVVSFAKTLNFRFDGNVCKDLKVGGDAALNLETQSVDAKLFGEYNLRDGTLVKFKVQNDNSVTLGLTHNYRGLVNFGFVSRVFILFNFSVQSCKLHPC